jgi:hypothetical protein
MIQSNKNETNRFRNDKIEFYLGNNGVTSINNIMSFDTFIFVLSAGWDYKGVISSDPIEEALFAISRGFQMGRSMGVETEDLYRLNIFVKKSEKGEKAKQFIKNYILEVYATGYIPEVNIPLGNFPIVYIEAVEELQDKDMNILLLFEFSDYENIANDGQRHFELGFLSNFIFPREIATSSYAIVKNHLFNYPVYSRVLEGTMWKPSENMDDLWNLLIKKSQFLGASINQLGYLTIQLKNLETQYQKTIDVIEKIFNNVPNDIFEGEEYSVIPEWFLGNHEDISQSYTGRKTIKIEFIDKLQTKASHIGSWIRTGAILFKSFEELSQRFNSFNIEQVLFIKVRLSIKNYSNTFYEEAERIRKFFYNKYSQKPLFILTSCKQLPQNMNISVVLYFPRFYFLR